MQKVKPEINYQIFLNENNCPVLKQWFNTRWRAIVVLSAVFLSILVIIYYSVSSGLTVSQSSSAHFIKYKEIKRRFPQCLIIGVRKGGTRALLEFLDLHSRIQVCHREVHFFDNDENYSLGLKWYQKKMPYTYPEQIVIEKTPAYFVDEDVPARIYKFNRSIKLVLVVRDPINRAVSDYVQIAEKRRKLNESSPKFEKLVFNQRTGKIRHQYPAIQHSVYYIHMQRWLRYFSLDQILIIDGRDLRDNPAQAVQDVETFLGLRHEITRNNFYFNKTRGFFCVKYMGSKRCLSKSKGRHHPDIDPRVLRKLQDFFHLWNQKFYKLINKVFDWL